MPRFSIKLLSKFGITKHKSRLIPIYYFCSCLSFTPLAHFSLCLALKEVACVGCKREDADDDILTHLHINKVLGPCQLREEGEIALSIK
jgi:hypothetical protein